MLSEDILSLLPMIILASGTVLLLLLIALHRSHLLTFLLSLLILATAFTALFFTISNLPHTISELVLLDNFSIYYHALILVTTFVICIFSYIRLKEYTSEKHREEYYLLLILATLGASMMVTSTHFITFFVSLELLSISMYSLIGFHREESQAIEAAIKYLILAAISSAFLLFGMAMVYAASGSMYFPEITAINPSHFQYSIHMMVGGIGLILVGIGFKLGVVPFHMWAPDVYQGASSPAAMFVSTVSKGAMIALLLRLTIMAKINDYEQILWILTGIAILSMLIGNLLALNQQNIKRLLAYSSISHFGYLLIAVIVGKEIGSEIATFYLTVYIIALTAAFGSISLLSKSNPEIDNPKGYESLFRKKPFLASVLIIVFLSLAGIPLTAGFMSKYLLLILGAGNSQWVLVFVLVLSSIIGFFYYLRVILAMLKPKDPSIIHEKNDADSPIIGKILLGLMALLLIIIGIYPDWILGIIHHIAT